MQICGKQLLVHQKYQLRNAADAVTSQGVFTVGFYSLCTQPGFLGYLPGGEAFGNKLYNFPFSCR